MTASFRTVSGEVFVTVSPQKVKEMLTDNPSGVYRNMLVRGEKVKQKAVELAPVGKPDPLGRPHPHGGVGNLRNHIVKRTVLIDGAPEVIVGIDAKAVPYAYGVHEGNPPHPIVARNAPLLVFFWPKIGAVVRTPAVNHPGNKPNRFLIRALDEAR